MRNMSTILKLLTHSAKNVSQVSQEDILSVSLSPKSDEEWGELLSSISAVGGSGECVLIYALFMTFVCPFCPYLRYIYSTFTPLTLTYTTQRLKVEVKLHLLLHLLQLHLQLFIHSSYSLLDYLIFLKHSLFNS